MRKRVVHTMFTTIAGALVGGVVVFWLLSQLGKTPSSSPAPNAVPVGTPAASPAPAVPSASVTPVLGRVPVEKLGVAFILPRGYRVAETLNAYDTERAPASPRLTVTAATAEQEKEYVALLRKLQQNQAATEAPEFAPGKTITLARAAASEHEYAQRLAKQNTTVTTQGGVTAKRYQRVEGLYPYDVAFITLPNGTLLSISMTYASGSETSFDEEAYMTILRTLETL